ncbi:hypothetical protein SAY86_003512 [Trapa natans]|uniref:BHLH domain-containing protein n=1 Tax=Trapa natans TaxID=22666 RepID=A0AAN7MWT2_TRANT|nr:hypothetical protein SAY86_003512 [Trapa natans]
MISIQNLMERLRPLVGSRGWDYCVVWKLGEDQRSFTWVGCCCGGADQYAPNGPGEDFHFPASQALPQCKDAMVSHTRSSPCELLSQLPSSMPLDSGIYTHSLLSNQSRWLNFASSLDSDIREETVGTKVLIPVSGGVLIELFVTKQVPEDPQTLDFVAAQCSLLMETDMLPSSMDSGYNVDTVNSRSVFNNVNNDQNDSFIQAPAEAQETPLNLPYDMPVDPIARTLENKGTGRADDMYSEAPMMNMESMNIEFVEPLLKSDTTMQGNNNDESKASLRRESGRTDSISDCSDQIEDEDHHKNGKKGQSKNLVAERNRRKKLNDRLYALRALVPRISKLDRASILGDAIEFIKDLQKQAKYLQDELEEHSDIEDGRLGGSSSNNIQSHGSGTNLVPITDPEKATAGCESYRQNHHDPDHTKFEKPQQMEPQVEVAQVDGNEFFVKVFGEHRPGGFVRLIEALDALGLEVTNVNTTSFRSLVSNIFTVEKKDSELVQADHVKVSLIELTRNPSAAWHAMMTKAPENNVPAAATTTKGDPLPQLHHHHLYSNIRLHGHHHHHFLSSPPPSSPF